MRGLGYREAKAWLGKQGMVLKVDDGEYNVNFKGGCEATRAYDSDLEAIVGTAMAMIKETNLHKGCEVCQPGKRTKVTT